jgi:hypothetical protein
VQLVINQNLVSWSVRLPSDLFNYNNALITRNLSLLCISITVMARYNVKRRALTHNNVNTRPSKQRRLLTKGTESQLVVVDDTQPSLSREALTIASQADDFESQLRDLQSETAIATPVKDLEVATAASTAANEDDDDDFDTRFVDNFESVD